MGPDSEKGFILHTRQFSDSKKILVAFTRAHGRISFVLRQSKKAPKPKNFTECLFSWIGRSDLKTLTDFEELGSPILNVGRSLFCGIYLNELCIRLLVENQQNEQAFDQYSETITKLRKCGDDSKLMEVLLRRFEFSLLSSLGLAINFSHCVNGELIASGTRYFKYEPQMGFQVVHKDHEYALDSSNARFFFEKDLTDIREQQWSSSALRAAKRLSRLALAPLLGEKPLKSRELFT